MTTGHVPFPYRSALGKRNDPLTSRPISGVPAPTDRSSNPGRSSRLAAHETAYQDASYRRDSMGTFRFQIAVSIDGYVAGPNQSMENPLGVGGMDLHRWLFDLEAWRASEGEEGGDINASTPVTEAGPAKSGAGVIGP